MNTDRPTVSEEGYVSFIREDGTRFLQYMMRSCRGRGLSGDLGVYYSLRSDESQMKRSITSKEETRKSVEHTDKTLDTVFAVQIEYRFV